MRNIPQTCWMAIFKKTSDNKVGEDVEKRESLCIVGRNVNWYSHYEKSMEGTQKSKNRITVWSSNPTSAYISKGNEISISKRYLHSYVHCSIIHSSQDMKCPLVDEWIKKICDISIYLSIYLSIYISHNTEYESWERRKSWFLWQHGWNLRALF